MHEEEGFRGAVVDVRNNQRPADGRSKPLLKISRIGGWLTGQRKRRGIQCGVIGGIVNRAVRLVHVGAAPAYPDRTASATPASPAPQPAAHWPTRRAGHACGLAILLVTGAQLVRTHSGETRRVRT